MPPLPTNPDIRRQLKDRLLNLSPRAFEFFASDLLTYIGIQNVTVTRFIGDGGIDAQGELIAQSGFVKVKTGVQFKRLRQNVQRPDIDRFIGALGGQFQHGIFITTAGYAEQAKVKAQLSPLLRVNTIDGDQVVMLMRQHHLGTRLASELSPQLDEDFFLTFEAQASNQPGQLVEPQTTYQTNLDVDGGTPARPEDNLISMRALGYELRVDPYTIQDWVRAGKVNADNVVKIGQRESYFFRRDRIDSIRSQIGLHSRPASGAEWRQAFLDYVRAKNLTKSYKPVLIKALLRLVNRHGEVPISALAQEFHAFYLQRERDNLRTEASSPLENPSVLTLEAVQKLIVKYPLDRFLLQHFLEYDRLTGIVRFAPQLWAELRFYELLDVQGSLDEQLRYYYDRLG
jgi:hypothetical protein